MGYSYKLVFQILFLPLSYLTAMDKANPVNISLQLAQNEAMGAGDHRPSISSRRKPSGTIQRKINHQNLLFSFICLLSCVFLLILFFGESALPPFMPRLLIGIHPQVSTQMSIPLLTASQRPLVTKTKSNMLW